MNWIGGLALFLVGVVTGFMLCGFLIMCAEDGREKEERDEMRGGRG